MKFAAISTPLILLFVVGSAVAADCKDGEVKQFGDQLYACNTKGQAWVTVGTFAPGTWKIGKSAEPSCLKDGKTTNKDGTVVQCRLVNGKVVPIN